MAKGEKKSGGKEKHKCPRLPEWAVQFKTPEWRGQGPEESRAMWMAHLRRVARLRPMSRKTTKERGEL